MVYPAPGSISPYFTLLVCIRFCLIISFSKVLLNRMLLSFMLIFDDWWLTMPGIGVTFRAFIVCSLKRERKYQAKRISPGSRHVRCGTRQNLNTITQTTEQTWSSRGIFDGSIFTIVLFWGVFSSTDCLPSSVETQTFWPAWSYFATCCLRFEISSVVIRKQGTQRRWSSHFYELLRNWRLAWIFLLCLFVVARLKFLENGKSIWNAHVLGGNHNL